MNQLETFLFPEFLVPGHGKTAAFHAIDITINISFIAIIDRSRTRQHKLEHDSASVFIRVNFWIIMQTAGIMAVIEIELVFPNYIGQLGKMLHNAMLHILSSHFVVNIL